MEPLARIAEWVKTLPFSFPDWQTGEHSDPERDQMQWVANRAAPAWVSQWERVRAAIKIQEQGQPLTAPEVTALEAIRAVGFNQAFASHEVYANEIADCAVADFNLLARAARVGFSDFWLDKLRAEYEAGRFPHGAL